MDGVWLQAGLVVVLVLVNAAFAGSEIALISLREGQLQRLDQQGGRGRLVARLARNPNQFLSTIQIGITLAGFLASAAAAVTLAEPLVEPLGFLGAAAEVVAVVLVTMALTYVTLVVGELAPKRVALQRPERWAKLAAGPLAAIATLSGPAVWLLSRSTDLVVRLAGGDPAVQRQQVTSQEVRDLVATEGTFTPQQRTILIGAVEVAERRVSDVLVPRRDMVALPATMPAAEAVGTLVATTHSRAPVYRRDLDDVLGVARQCLPDGACDRWADLALADQLVGLALKVLELLRTSPGWPSWMARVTSSASCSRSTPAWSIVPCHWPCPTSLSRTAWNLLVFSFGTWASGRPATSMRTALGS